MKPHATIISGSNKNSEGEFLTAGKRKKVAVNKKRMIRNADTGGVQNIKSTMITNT